MQTLGLGNLVYTRHWEILLCYRENKNQQVLLHRLSKTRAKAGGESPSGGKLTTASVKNNSSIQVRGSHQLWAAASKRGAQSTCWCSQDFWRLAKFIEREEERPSYCHSPSLDHCSSKSLACSRPTAWDERALVFWFTAQLGDCVKGQNKNKTNPRWRN